MKGSLMGVSTGLWHHVLYIILNDKYMNWGQKLLVDRGKRRSRDKERQSREEPGSVAASSCWNRQATQASVFIFYSFRKNTRNVAFYN